MIAVADINIEKLRDELYKVSKALFGIGETCVEASKQHISEKEALSKIRVYLNDVGVWSRFMVDQLIENCMGPDVSRALDDKQTEWVRKYLGKWNIESTEINFPSCCDGCSNNPKNGGSGICNCTLPYMQNPTTYTVNQEDLCMVNGTCGYVYATDTKLTNTSTVNIADAVERMKKYIKEEQM